MRVLYRRHDLGVTMSARDAYLTIYNNTGYDLINLQTPTPKDGKISSAPASTIGAGGSSQMEVSKSGDASTVGPQGYITYQVCCQGQYHTVQINWNFPDNSATSAAYTVSGDTRFAPSSTTNNSYGEHTQYIDVYIRFSSTALNNWDMVLAITQATLNNQLQLLASTALMPGKIQESTSSGTVSLTLSRISAPSVLITSVTNQLLLQLPVKSGTVTPTGATPVDLTGYTISVPANIAAADLTSSEGLFLSPEVAARVNAQLVNGLSVLALSLDVQAAAVAGQDAGAPKLTATNGQNSITDPATLATLADGLSAWATARAAKATVGRLVLSCVAYSHSPTASQSSLPGLIPTQSSFSTTYNSSNPEWSTLNVLMMVNGNLPSANNLSTFSPLINDASVWMLQCVDLYAFTQGCVVPVILPALQVALGAQSSDWGNSTSTYWNISYECDNRDQNDGKGEKTVENDECDYYTVNSANINCDVSLVDPTLAIRVYIWANLESKTTKYPLFGADWVPVLVNDTTDTASETAYLLVAATPEGTLGLRVSDPANNDPYSAPVLSRGTPVAKTGVVQDVVSWVKDSLSIGDNVTTFLSAQQSLVNNFQSAQHDNPLGDLGILSVVLSLPAGQDYTYGTVSLLSAGYVQIPLSTRSV